MKTAEQQQEHEQQRRLRELHRWHIRNFVSLDFTKGQAERLELENVDWHDAERLITRGCSHETAMLILI